MLQGTDSVSIYQKIGDQSDIKSDAFGQFLPNGLNAFRNDIERFASSNKEHLKELAISNELNRSVPAQIAEHQAIIKELEASLKAKAEAVKHKLRNDISKNFIFISYIPP